MGNPGMKCAGGADNGGSGRARWAERAGGSLGPGAACALFAGS